MRSLSSHAAVLTAAAGLCVLVGSARAGEPIIGLVDIPLVGEALVEFDSDTAIFTAAPVVITGLDAGEELVGIDIRPATGRLYGISSLSRIYTIDADTGVATPVAGAFTPAISGSDFGFDFNPVADRIRLVSDSNQNLRLHPDTGVVAFTDGTLRYAAADINAAADPSIVAAAYTNSERCPLTTQLFVIDSDLDILALQSPPNDGVLVTVGDLDLNAQDDASFDISGRTGVAFMTSTFLGLVPSLATVNLATGEATNVGVLNLGIAGLFTLKAIAAPGPCPADFNRDGFLDFFDYDAYVEAFESGNDPRADLNCDRFLDFFDYDAFVAQFESGC